MLLKPTQDITEFIPREDLRSTVLKYQTQKGIGELTILRKNSKTCYLSFCLRNEQEPLWRSQAILPDNIASTWAMWWPNQNNLFP